MGLVCQRVFGGQALDPGIQQGPCPKPKRHFSMGQDSSKDGGLLQSLQVYTEQFLSFEYKFKTENVT